MNGSGSQREELRIDVEDHFTIVGHRTVRISGIDCEAADLRMNLKEIVVELGEVGSRSPVARNTRLTRDE